MLVSLSLLPIAAATFNYSKCPSIHEVQAARVVKEFDMDDYVGYYYELAFHDILQAACPKVTCVNSNKTLHQYADGQNYISEAWGLSCLGHEYPQVLLNNITDEIGFFKSFVPIAKLPGIPTGLLKYLVFPNIVIDRKTGPNGWTLEFQCVDFLGHVPYIGINFYAKDTSEATYKEMLASAKASGIDFYFGSGFSFRRVDHSNCPDEPHATVAAAALLV